MEVALKVVHKVAEKGMTASEWGVGGLGVGFGSGFRMCGFGFRAWGCKGLGSGVWDFECEVWVLYPKPKALNPIP